MTMTEMKMCRWGHCGHTLREHVRNENIKERLKLESIAERCRKARLRCMVWPHKEARPRLRRKKDSGDGTTREKKARKTEAEMDGWTLSTETGEPSERRKTRSMTELAGGELCLPQRPHNQVGAARRRRKRIYNKEDYTRRATPMFCHILSNLAMVKNHLIYY